MEEPAPTPPGARPADRPATRTSGHRLVPHTADLTIEAWDATRTGCFGQAVLALVEAFATPVGEATTTSLPFRIDAAGDDELLVALLEEVIYAVEVVGAVPVAVEVEATADGGIRGRFDAVALDRVELVGSVPKGVTRHALAFAEDAGTWRCRATVDV